MLVAHVLGIHDQWTILGAWTFALSRLAFVPVYAFGITWLALRTLLYYLSLGGLALIATRILIMAPAGTLF
ncbi:hypothetical protein D3C87_2048470 [compost metagenome]